MDEPQKWYIIGREDKKPEVGDKIRILGETEPKQRFDFKFNAEQDDESRAVWDKFLETVQQPIIKQLHDQEDEYILNFFGGDIELVKKYAKDYYVEYSPLEMTEGEDGKYSVKQTMRMKRRTEIQP